MTSATERLRALLDERGVEWWPAKYYKDENTVWRANGMEWRASEQTDGKLLIGCTSLAHLTPEQAVAATLGPGTCEVEESWHGESEMVEYRCTACDEYIAVEVVKPDGAQRPNYCPNCGARVIGA